jgi:hypothetical protein
MIRHDCDTWGLPSMSHGRPDTWNEDLFSSDLSFCSTDVDPVHEKDDLHSSANAALHYSALVIRDLHNWVSHMTATLLTGWRVWTK